MHTYPQQYATLINCLAEVSLQFLKAQVESGASAVQLFDSWVGSLNITEYSQLAPASKYIISSIQKYKSQSNQNIKCIHFATNAYHLLQEIKTTGTDVLSIDDTISLHQASLAVPDTPLQGNINPAMLFADTKNLQKHTQNVIQQGYSLPSHIVNLGHGVPPTTNPNTLAKLVEFVHSLPAFVPAFE